VRRRRDGDDFMHEGDNPWGFSSRPAALKRHELNCFVHSISILVRRLILVGKSMKPCSFFGSDCPYENNIAMIDGTFTKSCWPGGLRNVEKNQIDQHMFFSGDKGS
jgi:hypothetical protein